MLRTSFFSLTILLVFSVSITAHAQESDRLPSAPERHVDRMLKRSENRANYRSTLREVRIPKTSVASVRERVYARTQTMQVRRQIAATKPAKTTRPTVTAQQKVVSSVTPPRVTASFSTLQEDILRLVNRERTAEGLSTLTLHPLLNTSAQRYAERMAKDRFFSHTDPDGGSSADRIRSTGYVQPPCDCSFRYVTGENLAKNQKTAAEAVRAWMQSPKHRDNVLHPQYEEMGLGYKDGYWAQHFGGIEAQ